MWARLTALPYEAPIWAVIEAEQEKANADAKENAVKATLARFRAPKGG